LDKDYIWNGINLHDSIWYGIMRVDLKCTIDIDKDKKTLQNLASSCFLLSEALSVYYKKNQVDGTFVSHGMYHIYGPFLDVAKFYKLPIAVWNEGYMRSNTMYLGMNKNIFDALIHEAPKNWSHISLLEKQKQKIVDQLRWEAPPMPDKFLTRIKKYKKIFAMYGNIPWDGAVTNATPLFPDTYSYIKYTLDWFKKNTDCILIIRSHPMELSSRSKKAEKMWDLVSQFELPENVVFIHPGDKITSYMLADVADASILYGGSMGIELAVAKKIAIQAGNFFWTDKGFLFECKDNNQLYDYFDRVKTNTLKLTDEMYENALRYAWHFIYEIHLDMDFITLSKQYPCLDNLDIIMKSKTLALIEKSLLNHTDIFQKSIN